MFKFNFIIAMIALISSNFGISDAQTVASHVLPNAPTIQIPNPSTFKGEDQPTAVQQFNVQKMQPFVPNNYEELPYCDEVYAGIQAEPVTMAQFLNVTGQKDGGLMVDPDKDIFELPAFLLKNNTASKRNNTTVPSNSQEPSVDARLTVITAIVSLLYLI